MSGGMYTHTLYCILDSARVQFWVSGESEIQLWRNVRCTKTPAWVNDSLYPKRMLAFFIAILFPGLPFRYKRISNVRFGCGSLTKTSASPDNNNTQREMLYKLVVLFYCSNNVECCGEGLRPCEAVGMCLRSSLEAEGYDFDQISRLI